jgi:hypothetical protein
VQPGNSDYRPFQGPDRRDLMAFTGIPERILLRPGDLLCRFITAENAKLNHYGNQVFRSPWWHTMSSFMQIYNLAKQVNAPLDSAARARLAITQEFNPTMQYFCQITITKPIYGWKGFARHQQESGSNLVYMGGGQQIYLPNLFSPASNGMSSDFAFIKYFGATDVLG